MAFSARRYFRWSGVLLLCLSAGLCWRLDSVLSDAPIIKDARQNLRAGFNLNAWGVFSVEAPPSGAPTPDNYREPVVPAAAALYMRLLPDFSSATAFEELSRGSLCRRVKRVNLFWAFLALLGAAALTVELTRSTIAAGVSSILTWAVFLRNPEHIDTLGTEIPTAAVMLWASLLLVRSVRTGRVRSLFFAGLLFGLLCLTKAVFLYLTPLVVPVVFFCCAPASRKKTLRALGLCALFTAGIAAAAGPWLLRNYAHVGSFSLTLRGGAVLYGRTFRNTMTRDELIGAVYLWGPGAYKKMVKNTFLDMAPDDFEKGGRAARLSRSADSGFARSDKEAERAGRPEQAVSFYSQSRALRTRLIRSFAAQGHPNPQLAADRRLQHEARRWIREHPLRHIMMTIPFAWRGVWCFYGGGVFTLLNALCYSALIGLACRAVLAGERRILAFELIPGAMLFFNAFLTHNLSRYTAPAIPHLVISGCVAVSVLTGRFSTAGSLKER